MSCVKESVLSYRLSSDFTSVAAFDSAEDIIVTSSARNTILQAHSLASQAVVAMLIM